MKGVVPIEQRGGASEKVQEIVVEGASGGVDGNDKRPSRRSQNDGVVVVVVIGVIVVVIVVAILLLLLLLTQGGCGGGRRGRGYADDKDDSDEEEQQKEWQDQEEKQRLEKTKTANAKSVLFSRGVIRQRLSRVVLAAASVVVMAMATTSAVTIRLFRANFFSLQQSLTA